MNVFLRQNANDNGHCYCSSECYAHWMTTQIGGQAFSIGDTVLVCNCFDGKKRARTLCQPECDCGRPELTVEATWTNQLAKEAIPISMSTNLLCHTFGLDQGDNHNTLRTHPILQACEADICCACTGCDACRQGEYGSGVNGDG